jgi:hypothetical protein
MGFLDALLDPTKNQRRGIRRATDEFGRAREVTDPFYTSMVSGGTGASRRLSDLLGLAGEGAQQTALDQFRTSPVYDANLRAGMSAVDRSAAARGMGQSGATMRALQATGQNLYDQEYDDYLNRLGGLVGGGQAGAAGLGGNAIQTGNLMMQRGAAKDAANAGAFNNVLGIAGTVMGGMQGMPSFGNGGNLFGSRSFNPWTSTAQF